VEERRSLEAMTARKRVVDNELELGITFEREERNLLMER